MNRYSMYLRTAMISAGLLLATFHAVYAQGFFTPTNHILRVVLDDAYSFPGNNYQIDVSYDPLGMDNTYFFGRLMLDSNGQETSWDGKVLEGDESTKFKRLANQHYLGIWSSETSTYWQLFNLNQSGDTIWQQSISKNMPHQTVEQLRQNAAGDIFISGFEYETSPLMGNTRFFLIKIDAAGNVVWQKNDPLEVNSSGPDVSLITTQDGGCLYNLTYLLNGGSSSVYKLEKIAADGNILWSDSPGTFSHLRFETNIGDLVSISVLYDPTLTFINLEKRNNNGQILWSKSISQILNIPTIFIYYLNKAANGDIWFVSADNDGSPIPTPRFSRLSSEGNLIWTKQYPFLKNWYGNVRNGASTPDDGLIFTSFLETDSSAFVLKIAANGDVYPWKIQGKVAIDDNVNCLVDPGESAPVDWKVKLSNTNLDLFTTVDSTGNYQMFDIPTGLYNLSMVLPSNLWENCPDSTAVSFLDTAQTTVTQDLAVQRVVECPFMSVDITTPVLRRCFSTRYVVQYCNAGTIAAENTNIDVLLDPLLIFQSASIPVTQSGDTLHFALGSVPALACGTFTFEVQVDCAAELGQSLCVQAHISPDTICNPAANWTGATLEASGHCDADSIRFQLRNVGKAASSNGLKFIVIDDHVITRESAIPVLNPAQSIWVSAPSNGDTWRFIADQEPNHPFEEIPNVGVEGCGTGSSGGQTFGFLLQFPNQDGNPFTDEDCHTVVGSYDPNDKSAVPQGLHAAHEIEPNQPIEYMIRFQNTGTDTAFTVVLRDTLDPALEVASLRPGAVSHPYKWTLNGQNILTVTFDNILLPDSFVNEAASHGFFQFKIDQKRNNPNLTRIENRAGIYFDFNAVVLTNTVFHTVKKDLLPAFETPARVGLPVLQLLPNPAVDQTLVWADQPLHIGQTIRVRDLYGRVVRDIPVTGSQVLLQRNGLSSGVYMLGLLEKGKMIAGGKLVWVNP